MDDLVVQNRLTRVLVVDDERAVGRITARMLNLDAEFDVVTEQDPTVALEKAQSESFDVVLSDILMPEMDGLELIRAIRAFNLDIPVILLTGTPSLESAQRAVELGAFRYLTKSVERRKLIETVKQAA
ncbi:MAG: response regulator [Pseudomonadales bacterium]|jgi:DNA-binding NtrC family response regulator|nr:response regulator [Pseudomonadales bacterium]MDP7595400.1 response regulator [Pseudomonadales bacterium]